MSKRDIAYYQVFALLFISRIVTVFTAGLLDNQNIFTLQTALINPLDGILLLLIVVPVFNLSRKYDMDVVDVVGHYIHSGVGKVLGVCYAGYFWATVLRSATRFILFSQTVSVNSLSSFAICLSLLCGALFIARRGLEAMGRAAIPIILFIVLVLVLIIIAILPDLSWQNIEPFYWDAETAAFSFLDFLARTSETVAFAFLIPRGKGKLKANIAFWFVTTTLITELFILLPPAALGQFAFHFLFPFYALATLQEQGIFQRLDAFYSGIWTVAVVFQMGCFLYLFEQALKPLTKGRGKVPLLVVATVLCLIAALVLVQSLSAEVINITTLVLGSYALVLFIVPWLVWLVMIWRERRGKQHAELAESQ